MLSLRSTGLVAAIVLTASAFAQAHFLWIAPDSSPHESQVHVYFSETPEADDPSLLSRLDGLKLREISMDGKSHDLKTIIGKQSIVAIPVATAPAQSFSLNHTYGLFGRGGEPSLLVYHSRMYPASARNQWQPPASKQQLPLELVPALADGKLVVRVLWKGQPLADAEMKGEAAGQRKIDGKTDASGSYAIAASEPGIYAFRAKHIEPVAGTHGGKKYANIRHYSTLVVTYVGEPSREVTARTVPPGAGTPGAGAPRAAVAKRSKLMRTSVKVQSRNKDHALPDLPFGITSFGAALVDQQLYVCAGQKGPAHEYSREGQSDQFLRLDLRSPHKWEALGIVPRGAGLAMVSYGGKIYRIGGFEARNKEGQKSDLHSVPDFSRFDPASGHWESLAPLPKGRSSHDAVVVGSRLIVVGGWELRGNEPSVWDDTVLAADLSTDRPTWEQISKAPFHRRALAVGEAQNKVYVLGGMQEQGGPTTTTYVLDLATHKWSTGPKLPGEGLEGFGGCAVTCGGQLFATTYAGKISRLSDDGQSWNEAGRLSRPRFFHRLLCAGGSSLVVVGGASMEEGKDSSVEFVTLSVPRVTRR
jgi:Domain of unknown function (DUF4198)/Kelch motif